MHFYLDCVPCFFKQGLFAARESGCTREEQKEILDAIALEIPKIRMEASPPENSLPVYQAIRRITRKDDPFKAVKKASNQAALAVYPELSRRVQKSSDPLLAAVEIAISGNIIDYGADTSFDLKAEIRKILNAETSRIKKEDRRIFDPERLRSELGKTRELLYVGDNAGEIVFDRVFIEFLLKEYPGLTIRYAVRGRPIINDVTMEDALEAGMDKVCEVIDSGSPAPGAVPLLCSPGFRKLLDSADLIISKGQGNYESLSGRGLPVFFLLRVKCPVIAADIPATLGDICLLKEG